jgi:hypothetical protein
LFSELPLLIIVPFSVFLYPLNISGINVVTIEQIICGGYKHAAWNMQSEPAVL